MMVRIVSLQMENFVALPLPNIKEEDKKTGLLLFYFPKYAFKPSSRVCDVSYVWPKVLIGLS